jgi:four helix bundle protein
MGDFKKLQAWQLGHKIVCEVYRETVAFPKTEAYGLTAQLRRAAASIPANIAEGSGRRGDVEFGRFVRIALGSAAELEYHLLLAHDIGLLGSEEYQRLRSQVLRLEGMLRGLNTTLRRQPGPSKTPTLAPSP